MNHEKHHGHFEAPREKKRLTGRQKGALGIVLALAVLIGLGVGIYKTVVRPPQKTEPVVETQPEAEETKEPEIKLPTIKHVVTKVDEDTGEEIEEELELPASHREGVYNILICGTDDDGYRTDTIIVAHLDEETHDVALMSVPRDTVVLTGNGGIMKINSVYAGGGADGMARLSKRLGAMLGFELDGYVLVNLEAFRETVDLVDGVEFDGGTDKGVDLTIGSGTFIPGFEDGLIGAAIGKEINVNVTFPENYGNTDVAGKDAVFAVTVNFVKKAPEMTDDIVAEISDHKTVDEYRKGVEEQLKADKEAQQNSDKINGILNQIYSASTINGYPEEVVNYRTAQMKAYYTQIAEQSDMTLADFLSNQLQMTEEQFDQQCPAVIKQSMIQELLLKAVAESENMEISDEENEAGI